MNNINVIPSVDILEGQVVRLKQGDPKQVTVYDENPISTAKRWVEDGAEMIHVVDLDSTLGRGENVEVIRGLIKNIDIKLQIGGGIRNTNYAVDLLDRGAWRVILGTLALSDHSSLSSLLLKFGSERIGVALDYELGRVKSRGWQSFTDLNIENALEIFRKIGVRYFLMTSVERDGLLNGPDIQTLSKACQLEGIKIIASGGIRNINDILCLEKIGAWGAIVGTALYEKKISLTEIYDKKS